MPCVERRPSGANYDAAVATAASWIRSRVRAKQRLLVWEDDRFDRRLGLVTSGEAEPTDLTVPTGEAETGFSYVATPVRLARWWLDALPPEPRRFTFIDLGSGKGRVLALAAEHGFGRVLGVEFAAELHEAARRNATAAAEHGVHFEPRLGDAAAFAFPDDPLVVHFNNPFAETVMECVIENLGRWYEHTPRPLVVVYQRRTVEERRHDTSNLELLDAVPWLRGRSLAPEGRLDRRLLSGFTVRVFENPEARSDPVR